MQTEQELEDEKKAIERMNALEAAKPFYARAWDRYQDWREHYWFVMPSIGTLFILLTVIMAVKACGQR